jgi:tetratricopeptide (TPR) repeat protein
LDQIYSFFEATNAWLTPIGLETRDVLFGILFGAFAYLAQAWTRGQNAKRQARDEMFALLSQIIDAKSQLVLARAEGEQVSTQIYSARLEAITSKLEALCQRARDLEAQENVTLSAGDSAVLAEALGYLRHAAAAGYWKMAERSAGDPARAVSIYTRYGAYLYEFGDPDDAERIFEKLHAGLNGAGQPELQGNAFYNQGSGEATAGRYAKAGSRYDEAERWYQQMQSTSSRAYRLRTVAEARTILAGLAGAAA